MTDVHDADRAAALDWQRVQDECAVLDAIENGERDEAADRAFVQDFRSTYRLPTP